MFQHLLGGQRTELEKNRPMQPVEEATYLANFIWAAGLLQSCQLLKNFQVGLPVDFRRNQTFQGIMRKVAWVIRGENPMP